MLQMDSSRRTRDSGWTDIFRIVGLPVQLGPSSQTREYSHPSPCCIPPAQWGDMHARDREEECELSGDMPAGHESGIMVNPFESGEHQDELDNAGAMNATDSMRENLSGPTCVNGNLMRPVPAGGGAVHCMQAARSQCTRRSSTRSRPYRIW